MCLAVPGKVIAIHGDNAQVDFQGNRREVSVMLTPNIALGDWVLVHAGFAISQLDATDARQTWQYLEEIARLDDTPVEGMPDGSIH